MAKHKDEGPKRSTKQILGTILKVVKDVFRASPVATSAIVVSAVLFALFPFGFSFISGLVIDELTAMVNVGNSELVGNIVTLIAIYAGLTIASRLTDTLYAFYDRKQFQRLNEYFTLQFLKKSSDLDLYHYENSDQNDLIQRAKQSYGHRPQNTFGSIIWGTSAFIGVITSFGIIASFSVPLFLVLLVTSIPTLYLNIKYSDLSYGIWDAKTEVKRRFWESSHFLQDEPSLMELRIFGTKNFLFDIVKNTYLDFFGAEQKAARRHGLFDSIGGMLSEGGLIILYVSLIASVLAGDITIGIFSFYVASAGRFASNLGSFFRRFTRAREHANYMFDYYQFMQLENTIVSGKEKIDRSPTPPKIEFKHVDFTYPGANSPVLDNFELTIEPGDRIAFVGENGAGKTTIIKLLSRFYDVTSGQILIDGKDIRDYEIDEWYSQLGILFQDFVKYKFLPAKQSIGVGDVNKIDNLDEIVESAKKSGADEFISKLSDQYEQVLSKRFPGGVDLSGGQWQRVALARAFFRDAPILVLDEPTSAIDPEGESEIFEKLYEFTEGKTVIIISHRFSTVRQADKIFVVEKGKIIEGGTHEDLMKLNGKYATAFETQAKGYQ